MAAILCGPQYADVERNEITGLKSLLKTYGGLFHNLSKAISISCNPILLQTIIDVMAKTKKMDGGSFKHPLFRYLCVCNYTPTNIFMSSDLSEIIRSISLPWNCHITVSHSTSTSTSTSKSFIEKIHRHIFNNHETETHEGLFASLFHGLSLHCKYSNLCWKSWLVQVHWNNKTCAWHSIYDWYYYCEYRD